MKFYKITLLLLLPIIGIAAPISADDVVLPNFSKLVKSLKGSVVNVSVEGLSAEEEQSEDPANQQKRDPESPFRSVGSGFIISDDGKIVTNYHVVGNADEIIVRLPDDKNEYRGTVLGKDQKTDLALVKIVPREKLTPAILGDSDQLEVGEWVLAIGNQFQLGQTVTAGIVSAKSRKVPSRGSPYDSYIQTDASINPGSSGGPLFNTKGEVVGINSAIFSPGRSQLGGSGFNIGIGFSIPINQAKAILEQLEKSGKVTRGMLGVIIQPIDADISDALKLGSQDGALVADVVPGSPAAEAGFRRRDVILSFDGHPIRDYDDLPALVASTEIGKKTALEIRRGSKNETLYAIVRELKDKGAVADEKPKPNVIGLTVQEVSPELSKSLDLSGNAGLLVLGVEARSAAEKSGVQRGDVIEEIGGVPVGTIEELERAVAAMEPGKPVIFTIRKKEGTRLLVLKKK